MASSNTKCASRLRHPRCSAVLKTWRRTKLSEHLISSKEMAQFVASGYLKFEEMVPKDVSQACLEDMKNHRGYLDVGTPFEETWPKGSRRSAMCSVCLRSKG